MKPKPVEREVQRVEFLWPCDLVSAIETHGRKNHLDRTAAALDLVRQALENQAAKDAAALWRESGARAQLEVLASRLDCLEFFVRLIASRTFGLDALVMEWVLRTGVAKGSADELRDEVRAAGADALECLLDALEQGSRSVFAPGVGKRPASR